MVSSSNSRRSRAFSLAPSHTSPQARSHKAHARNLRVLRRCRNWEFVAAHSISTLHICNFHGIFTASGKTETTQHILRRAHGIITHKFKAMFIVHGLLSLHTDEYVVGFRIFGIRVVAIVGRHQRLFLERGSGALLFTMLSWQFRMML